MWRFFIFLTNEKKGAWYTNIHIINIHMKKKQKKMNKEFNQIITDDDGDNFPVPIFFPKISYLDFFLGFF